MLLARPRRNRKTSAIRNLVEENVLRPADLVMPFFVIEDEQKQEEIKSLPGVMRLSLDLILKEAEKLHRQGIPSIALFPVIDPKLKDEQGTAALHENGLIVRVLQTLKREIPSLCLITDIALDPFTSHGHDGVVDHRGYVMNDPTVEILCKMACLFGAAGADIVAPSDMMDGRIGAIRRQLDLSGLQEVGILSYTAKYASSLYGPFREAVGSTLKFGDKKTYQMNPANSREAVRQAILDAEQGADILLVKPALYYLDVITKIKEKVHLPLCAYHVSGEYAMVMAAHANGWLDGPKVFHEALLSIKRAGADFIFSYAVPKVLSLLELKPF
ncbi:MAG TPA: porphobilinogen synthase [Rhabdochlamydiaceae bacterium]|nr:porphobilinogen synthase [Rhabdochlamydiaceae bacterium]